MVACAPVTVTTADAPVVVTSAEAPVVVIVVETDAAPYRGIGGRAAADDVAAADPVDSTIVLL